MKLQITTMLLSLVVLSSCSTCGNEVAQTIASPSGHLTAMVFNRNCGATTGFNTQVSIISGLDTLPNDGGNVLILDGTVPLRVHWQSDSALQLAGVGSAKIFKQAKVVAGVSVSYGN